MQLVLFVPGSVMLWPDLMQMESMFSHIDSIQSLDQVQDWLLHYHIRPLPWLLALIPSVWVTVDCFLLILRKFTDGQGNKMTRWV
jgi:hypothetical protein